MAAVICPAAGRAQSFDFEHSPPQVISLNGLWRFHPGDDPAWAAPTFDDARWALLRSDRSWSTQGYPGMGGYAWYRFTVTLPATPRPASLLLGAILTSYELYLDGVRVAGVGDMPPSRAPVAHLESHLFPLTTGPNPAPRVVHVALRVWHWPALATAAGGGPRAGHYAGDTVWLTAEKGRRDLVRKVAHVDYYTFSVPALLFGFAVLALYLFRRRDREYLWFAVMVLALGAFSIETVYDGIYASVPFAVDDLIGGSLLAIHLGAGMLFLSRVLRVRLGIAGMIILALLGLSPLFAVFYWFGWTSYPLSGGLETLCELTAALWILVMLTWRAVRRDPDARLLLVPILIPYSFAAAKDVAFVGGLLGFFEIPEIFTESLPLEPFKLDPIVLFDLFFLIAMLAFLMRRFHITRREEDRYRTEIEAAREVQQILLPDTDGALESVPGFSVESVYLPAGVVSGDFFQRIPDGLGGLLVVVGDVAGKGLPAAMMVSTLVGIIRTQAGHSSSPAALLLELNQRMLGRSHGGFATCLAAHIAADGRLTLANAGHLPPYLNGTEIEIIGALPLGITAGIAVETVTRMLEPGDRITFVSDGVVEAQSASGELFGFDRTHELSAQSAESIARAARAFGQNDDITVVSVEFLGEPIPIT